MRDATPTHMSKGIEGRRSRLHAALRAIDRNRQVIARRNGRAIFEPTARVGKGTRWLPATTARDPHPRGGHAGFARTPHFAVAGSAAIEMRGTASSSARV